MKAPPYTRACTHTHTHTHTHTAPRDADVQHLLPALASLQELRLGSCTHLTTIAMETISRSPAAPLLRLLDVSGCWLVHSLVPLAVCTSLRCVAALCELAMCVNVNVCVCVCVEGGGAPRFIPTRLTGLEVIVRLDTHHHRLPPPDASCAEGGWMPEAAGRCRMQTSAHYCAAALSCSTWGCGGAPPWGMMHSAALRIRYLSS